MLLVLDGSRVDDIASFYDEVNRRFMADEDWRLGPSLDALDDILYGGYGAAAGAANLRIVWLESERSRAALGVEATLAWLDSKLAEPETFDVVAISAQRAALLDGSGPTYFELVLDVFAGHPEVDLELA